MDVTAPPGNSACFSVELHYAEDGVHGKVMRDGADAPEPFGSWLELLRILEAPRPAIHTGPQSHNHR